MHREERRHIKVQSDAIASCKASTCESAFLVGCSRKYCSVKVNTRIVITSPLRLVMGIGRVISLLLYATIPKFIEMPNSELDELTQLEMIPFA